MGVIAEETVRIRPDTKGFKNDVERNVGGSLKTVAGLATTLFAGVAVTRFVGSAISDLEQLSAVTSQTAAAIKSTGGASNVTAAQIRSMSSDLESLSGVDENAIQSGANLLLTFTNIRNEAGKGNDVFNQSTKTLLDLSTAMGTQPQQAAIQLGKALNDPVKGITALTRVGVTFDAAQKKQIATLVSHGQTVKAQKIILAELNKEFGGSAKALGESLPGQINRVKDLFADLGRDLVAKLIPAFTKTVDIIREHWPEIQRVVKQVFDAIGATVAVGVSFIQSHGEEIKAALRGVTEAIAGLVGFIRDHQDLFVPFAIGIGVATAAIALYAIAAGAAAAATAALLSPIFLIGAAIALLVGGFILLYEKSDTAHKIIDQAFRGIKVVVADVASFIKVFVAEVSALWERWGGTITAVVKFYFGLVKVYVETYINIAKDTIKLVLDLIHGHWAKAWDDIKNIVGDVLGGVVAILGKTLPVLGSLAKKLGSALVEGLVELVKHIPDLLKFYFLTIPTKMIELYALFYKAAFDLGKKIVTGAIDGITGLASAIKDKAEAEIKKGLSSLNPFSPVEHGGEMYIGLPIVTGTLKGLQQLGPKMAASITQNVRDAVNQAKQNAISLGGNISGILGQFLDAKLGSSQQSKELQSALAYQKALQDKARLAELNAAIDTATSEEERQKATADRDVLLAQQKFDLLQQETDARKAATEIQISDLTAGLNKGLITQKNFNEQLKALFAQDGASYEEIGSQLGFAFAENFKAQLAGLQAQVKEIISGPRVGGAGFNVGQAVSPMAALLKELADARAKLGEDIKAKADAAKTKKDASDDARAKTAVDADKVLIAKLEELIKAVRGQPTVGTVTVNADNPQELLNQLALLARG